MIRKTETHLGVRRIVLHYEMLDLNTLLLVALPNRLIDLLQLIYRHVWIQAMHLLELLEGGHAERLQYLPLRFRLSHADVERHDLGPMAPPEEPTQGVHLAVQSRDQETIPEC